jgi:hypothetical protein
MKIPNLKRPSTICVTISKWAGRIVEDESFWRIVRFWGWNSSLLNQDMTGSSSDLRKFEQEFGGGCVPFDAEGETRMLHRVAIDSL